MYITARIDTLATEALEYIFQTSPSPGPLTVSPEQVLFVLEDAYRTLGTRP